MDFNLPIGDAADAVVEFLLDNAQWLFDGIDIAVEAVADSVTAALMFLPGVVLAAIFVAIAFWRLGWRFAVFAALSLAVVFGLDLWPQTITTLSLVITSTLIALLIAVPIGVISAYRQYSAFDQVGTFVSMIGFSVPPFFTGVLVIVIFSVQLGWLPSIYDTTHRVVDWNSFVFQVQQMIMPVMVLALQTTAQISRFMRASMLDNLNQDYVRTARAKGLSERSVVLTHTLRNSMIPVVTVIALGVPGIFGGAIITEQVFKVNGIGQLLITAIQANDLPLVQTLTFIFAVLIVLFNLIADILYGLLDPRIRYD